MTGPWLARCGRRRTRTLATLGNKVPGQHSLQVGVNATLGGRGAPTGSKPVPG